jgi:hypothetical protein
MFIETYLVGGAICLLMFASWYIPRLNYKRRMVTASSYFFALMAQGIPDEDAFRRTCTLFHLESKSDKQRLLHICTTLQSEAATYRAVCIAEREMYPI